MAWKSSVEEYLASNKYPAKRHAELVAKELKLTSGLLYLESQKSKLLEDNDTEAPFRQRRYFFYLSGCNLPDCYLTYNIADKVLTLYIPGINNEDVMWSGLPLSVEQAMDKYDVDQVKYTEQLETDIKTVEGEVIGIENQVEDKIMVLSVQDGKELKDAIEECRAYKDEYEIALIRHANEISTEAHESVMKAVKRVKNERELEAIFLEVCMKLGARNQAYPSIVASGRSGSTLHYIHNNQSITSKQTILLDAGCEYDCYASDITRVIPINGTFNQECKEIYDIVLKMQKDALAMMKPGVLWDDVHKLVHHIMIQGLLDLGVLQNGTVEEIWNNKTSAAFLPHGLGHYLGMDTHDTGGHPNYSDPDPLFKYLRCRNKLKPGNVITVEPGLYFCEFIIKPYLENPKHNKYINKTILDKYWDVGGVRIEDNVLITEDGIENLTATIKEVEDVEKMVNSGEDSSL